MSMARRGKRLVRVLAGAGTFYALLARHGWYRGAGEIKRRWQSGDGALGDYLKLQAEIKKSLVDDYLFATTHASHSRPSDQVLEQFGDDTLSGYGTEVYDKGGDSVPAQQRGLVLPLLERAMAETPGAVCEFGAGNGDVVAHLAERHPDREFVGIDFSTASARRKWVLPNIRFLQGYAADILQAHPSEFDTVFASSTFIFFTPAEMAVYAERLRQAGVRAVVLSEPHWFGWSADRLRGDVRSLHMESALWFHDYRSYLTAQGYRIRHFEERPYKHPRSQRPDLVITLLWASL